MTQNRRSILFDLAIVAVLAAIAAVGYRFSPLLMPKADLTFTPSPSCDLHRQSCRVDLPDGAAVVLSITPHPIPVVKPLQVNATLSGLTADKVELDFSGADMNMGYNRVTLQPSQPGRYSGQAMLPVCVTGRMEWVATLMVASGREHIAIPFHFEAPIGS